jgi:hypothetical protein
MLDLGDDALWVVEPRKVPCPGNPNEAKVRIRRHESLTLHRRSERVAFAPDEERRRRQSLPTLAENQLRSNAKPSDVGYALDQAEHALDISSLVPGVDV